jgi:hypothetical protein
MQNQAGSNTTREYGWITEGGVLKIVCYASKTEDCFVVGGNPEDSYGLGIAKELPRFKIKHWLRQRSKSITFSRGWRGRIPMRSGSYTCCECQAICCWPGRPKSQTSRMAANCTEKVLGLI